MAERQINAPVIHRPQSIIQVDRTQPFDPKNFPSSHGPDWYVVNHEEDRRSLAINEFDIDRILLVPTYDQEEERVCGRTNFLRLKASGYVLLDAAVFNAIIENPKILFTSGKKTEHILHIDFPGTYLWNSSCANMLFVLSMYVDNLKSTLGYRYRRVDVSRSRFDRSAVYSSSGLN